MYATSAVVEWKTDFRTRGNFLHRKYPLRRNCNLWKCIGGETNPVHSNPPLKDDEEKKKKEMKGKKKQEYKIKWKKLKLPRQQS